MDEDKEVAFTFIHTEVLYFNLLLNSAAETLASFHPPSPYFVDLAATQENSGTGNWMLKFQELLKYLLSDVGDTCKAVTSPSRRDTHKHPVSADI